MSFVGFIKNNQDFCQVVDLLDLVDLKQLTEEEIKSLDDYKVKTGTFNNSKVLHLCKCPIYTKTQNEEYYLNNATSYKLVDNDTTQQFMLVDNDKKTIIIDFCKLGYMLSRINSTLFIKGNVKIFKTNIDDYEIKSFDFINEELFNNIENIQKELINKHQDKLYDIAKEVVNDSASEENFINMAKSVYLLDKDIEEDNPNVEYLLDKNDCKIYTNSDYYIVLYLRDKEKFSNALEEEFDRIVDNKLHTTTLNSLKFYAYKMTKDTFNKLKSDFQKDKELNNLKEILNCLNQAGKTIVVNGNKYKNNIIKSDYYDKIQIGTGNKTILLSEVKTVMFGKKVLYSAI